MGTVTALLVTGIEAYRRMISPWLRDSCRFEPSCSRYAIEALKRYGALKGTALSLRRILRCRPFGGTGYDPLPERPSGEVE